MADPVALLLDFGGTLDSDGVPWSSRFFRGYVARGGARTEDEFERIFRATDVALLDDPRTKRIGFATMIRRQAELAAEATGEPLEWDAIAAEFHADSVATLERNRPMLERLHARVELVIVSNFCGNLAVCLDELGLAPLMSAVIDSAAIGVQKPEPAIFEAALAAVAVSPERAWFVGDNPWNDILPALSLGMRACWLAPHARAAPPEIAQATRIHQLLGVEEVLK